MFKKLSLASLVISTLAFNNVYAITCANSWDGLPFYDAEIIKGIGSVSCVYQYGPNQGMKFYIATQYGGYPISGPWQNQAGRFFCQAPNDPGQCVFGINSKK